MKHEFKQNPPLYLCVKMLQICALVMLRVSKYSIVRKKIITVCILLCVKMAKGLQMSFSSNDTSSPF